MALQPANEEHVRATLQIVAAYLDDPENRTPNNMIEGMASAKSLFRAILAGHLVVCQEAVPEVKEPTPKKTPRKKITKKST